MSLFKSKQKDEGLVFVEAWMDAGSLMPGFHHSVAVLRSVAIPLPLRVRTEMLETSFRIHRDEVTRTLIGCPPTAERQWWKPGIS